ncbi:TPA: acyltransferase family protein [Serratia fonticola]
MKDNRFVVLDSFRGLCAVFVVIFHMRAAGSITEWTFFKGSAIFVNFFFVLSGFVMAHAYTRRDTINFKNYIKSRFLRIYPLYIFMLAIFIILEASKMIAYKKMGIVFNTMPFTGKGDPIEIIPNLLMIQSWTSLTEHLSFNYPSWSISIEFYTYILFFISIHFLKKIRLISYFLIPGIIAFLFFLTNGFITKVASVSVMFFFFGAISYDLSKRITIKSTLFFNALEFLLLAIVAYITCNDFVYKPIVSAIVFSMVVVIFSKEKGVLSHLLSKGLFLNIGKVSYSIYLTHAAILFCLVSGLIVLQKITGHELTRMVNGERTLDIGNVTINNLMVFFILAVTIYISNLTYKYIEVKFNRKEVKNNNKISPIN